MTPGTFLTPTRNYMDLLTTDPFRLLQKRFFDEPFAMFKPLTPEENFPLMAWTPPCDIYETDKTVVLKIELPEVKREAVEVSLENNVLVMKGERKFEEKTENEGYHRIERRYGEFMRSFTLPTYVDPKKINAEFKDGVLTITLPKHEEARPKHITVKVN